MINGHIYLFFVLFQIFYILRANPIVLKESSPTGDTVVAISSSNPNIEKLLAFPSRSGINEETDTVVTLSPQDVFQRSFAFTGPGKASAGTGRSFVSTSAFNPFVLPLFNLPLNLEGFGLANFESPNWIKSIENFYEPSFAGNGEVKTVTAVNENGHVYGKVKTVTFDNRAKSVE